MDIPSTALQEIVKGYATIVRKHRSGRKGRKSSRMIIG